ncbi:hypothetical protein MUN74_04660 [Agromyces endophyticus]|uniref:hypothetical protein n=1 Tax=Agromyces sp. H17E-10 TaxID=2932244 RepID=UPI001FD5ED31|nr:hypothetical protein [Agromyces sp. H17E-10]UOQ90215.1 hypothetical protein MUN74_04660 [Agromyces sp. H17E-10]
MTSASRSDEGHAPTPPPPHPALLVIIPIGLGLAGWMAAGLYASSLIVVLFGNLAGVVIVVGVLAASITGFFFALRAVDRRRHLLAAVLLALVPVAGIAIAVRSSGEIPLDRVLGLPAEAVIGVATGALSMLALPRWWRLAGAICAVAIAVPLVVPIVTDVQQQAAEAQEREAALREQLFQSLVDPISTDLGGTTAELTSSSNDAAGVTVDRNGHELSITTTPTGNPGTADPDGFACWRVVGGGGQGFEGDETMADFAGRCEIIDGGWATTDRLVAGTRLDDDRWVEVRAGSGATAEDVAAVFGSLVELPESELRAWHEAEADKHRGDD